MQKTVVGVALLVAALGPLLVVTGKVLTGFQAIRNFTFKRQVAGAPAVPASGPMGSAMRPGAAPAGSTAAEQRNTQAVNQNTLAHQRSTSATNSETAASGRSAAATNRETLADSRQTAATNIETASDRRAAAASTLAGTRVGTLGNRAGNAAGSVTTLGGASGRAKGSILGMDKGAVKSAATFAALAIAVTFTMNQLSKLGNAIDEMDAAAKQADTAKNDALSNAKHALDRVEKKYGKDSPEYAKFLKVYLDILKQIQGDAYKKPWWASAASGIKGGIGTGWNWAFGGAQADGGSYVVDRPTLFLAGEKGIETATFTPQRRAQPGSRGGVTFSNCTFVAQDPDALLRKIEDRMNRRQLALASTGF
jgi:hypothetical protein